MAWHASENDAPAFAAIHWMANSIENLSAELYASDRRSLEDVSAILATCRSALLAKRRAMIQGGSNPDCPPGWVLCGGICMVSCDQEDLSAATAASNLRR